MVLKEQGMRLPTLDEYLEILLPIDGPLDDETVNQYGMVTTGDPGDLLLVRTAHDKYRMVPGPEFSPRLYRGQISRYSSCKAGIYREISKGNWFQKYIDSCFWSLKSAELGALLINHPALNDLRQWDFDGLTFDLNLEALAQHYGYPTSMLDASRDKSVALFFATHSFNADGTATPAIGNKAVLYTIDVKTLAAKGHGEENRVYPIGVDPLPRSSAQKAFSINLGISDDLEKMKGVSIEEFEVTEELARNVSEQVGGMETVFPYDPFEEKIDDLRRNNSISFQIISDVYRANFLPDGAKPDKIASLLERGGFNITEKQLPKPTEKMIEEAKKEWEGRRQSYIDRIKWRGAADHKAD